MGVFGNLRSIFSVGSTVDASGLQHPQDLTPDLAKSERVGDAKSIIEDPLQLVQNLNYKEKPSSLTYDTLNRMATRNSVISSIITTRVNQVSSFTQPARFTKDGVGFEITLRNPKAKPTPEQKQQMLALETFIENCGYSYNPSRDSFDTLVRKIIRDSLVYDQMSFEVVPDRLGRPAEILAVDAATIRAASVDIEGKDFHNPTDYLTQDGIKWVQLINGQVAAEFTGSELAFSVRNPRTDVNTQPYGVAELETLVHQVTSHLWAEEYNSRYFSQGGTTKGILNLKGQNISREQLEGFRRQWTAQVAGVTGAWKTPVVSVDGLEYINVSQSNREMEYELWMNYLINICCAVYQIDPAEINFPNRGGSSGSGGGGLGDGGIEDRLKNSKDKGLRPLLRFLQDSINRYIIRRFSNDFSFNFVGLDPDKEASKQAVSDKQVRTYKTINEIRKENDYDPIEGGDIILDQIYTQNLMQQKQEEAMQQQEGGGAEEEGMEGEGEPVVDYGGDGEAPPEESNEEQIKQQEDQAIGESIDSTY